MRLNGGRGSTRVKIFILDFFSSPSSYVCTFLYGSNFIRAWRRALDGKDDHVVSSMLLCPNRLRITCPQFFKMIPLKSVELPPAPHFSRIYMKALKVQLLNWSQKTVLTFYDSLVFFNIHWLSFSFSSTTHLSLTACVHCLDISITHARIIRPTVLRHATWVHANITILFEILKPLGMFTIPLRCAIQTLT